MSDLQSPPPDVRYPAWTSSLEPAPGDLRIVQAFVNTRDLEQGTDDLADPRQLAAWLERWRLLPAATAAEPIGESQRRRAVELREGLRALLLAHNGEPLDPEATGRIHRATREVRLRVCFDEEGAARLEATSGDFDGALARLLGIVVAAGLEATWGRLKACAHDSCQWAFYDFSKNRSGRWCSMQRCGNQLKARAYRRRRKRNA